MEKTKLTWKKVKVYSNNLTLDGMAENNKICIKDQNMKFLRRKLQILGIAVIKTVTKAGTAIINKLFMHIIKIWSKNSIAGKDDYVTKPLILVGRRKG